MRQAVREVLRSGGGRILSPDKLKGLVLNAAHSEEDYNHGVKSVARRHKQ